MIKKLQALGVTVEQNNKTAMLYIDTVRISIIQGKNKAELNEKLEKLFEDKERLTLFASYISKFLKDKKTDWISAISKTARGLHPWNTDGCESLLSLISNIFLYHLCSMFRNSTNKI